MRAHSVDRARGSLRLALSCHTKMQDDEEEPPLTLDEILGLIRSPATEDRIDGLIELSLLIDSAYGEEGAAIGQWVRQSGALQLLAWLVVDSSAEVQQQSLLVLGNLCSDACDPNSTLTKSISSRVETSTIDESAAEMAVA